MVKKRIKAAAAAANLANARKAKLGRSSTRRSATNNSESSESFPNFDTTNPTSSISNTDTSQSSSIGVSSSTSSESRRTTNQRRNTEVQSAALVPIADNCSNHVPQPTTRQLLVPKGGMKPKRQIMHKYNKLNGEIPEVQQEKRKRGRPPKKPAAIARAAAVAAARGGDGGGGNSNNFQDLFLNHLRQHQQPQDLEEVGPISEDDTNLDDSEIVQPDEVTEDDVTEELEMHEEHLEEIDSQDEGDVESHEDVDIALLSMEEISQSDENVIRIIELVDAHDEEEVVASEEEETEIYQDCEIDLIEEIVDVSPKDDDELIDELPDSEDSNVAVAHICEEAEENSQDEVEIIPYDESHNNVIEVEVVTEVQEDVECTNESSDSNQFQTETFKPIEISSKEVPSVRKPFKRTDRIVTRRSRLLLAEQLEFENSNSSNDSSKLKVEKSKCETEKTTSNLPKSNHTNEATSNILEDCKSKISRDQSPTPTIVVHKKYGTRRSSVHIKDFKTETTAIAIPTQSNQLPKFTTRDLLDIYPEMKICKIQLENCTSTFLQAEKMASMSIVHKEKVELKIVQPESPAEKKKEEIPDSSAIGQTEDSKIAIEFPEKKTWKSKRGRKSMAENCVKNNQETMEQLRESENVAVVLDKTESLVITKVTESPEEVAVNSKIVDLDKSELADKIVENGISLHQELESLESMEIKPSDSPHILHLVKEKIPPNDRDLSIHEVPVKIDELPINVEEKLAVQSCSTVSKSISVSHECPSNLDDCTSPSNKTESITKIASDDSIPREDDNSSSANSDISTQSSEKIKVNDSNPSSVISAIAIIEMDVKTVGNETNSSSNAHELQTKPTLDSEDALPNTLKISDPKEKASTELEQNYQSVPVEEPKECDTTKISIPDIPTDCTKLPLATASDVPSKNKVSESHENGRLKQNKLLNACHSKEKVLKSEKKIKKLEEKKMKKLEDKLAKKEERDRLKNDKKLAKEMKKLQKKMCSQKKKPSTAAESTKKRKNIPPITDPENPVKSITKHDNNLERDESSRSLLDSSDASKLNSSEITNCLELDKSASSYHSMSRRSSCDSSLLLDSTNWDEDDATNGIKYSSSSGVSSISDNWIDQLSELKPDLCSESTENMATIDGSDADGNIRRSGRIRTIKQTRRRSHGHGLVRDKDRFLGNSSDASNSALVETSQNPTYVMDPDVLKKMEEKWRCDMLESLKLFTQIIENEFKCERMIYDNDKMSCDCFLTAEDIESNELGCGEDCLNRMLMIECGPTCTVAERCTNRRFQKHRYSKCRVFKTDKKGFGIMGVNMIPAGEFIMEYVGEVLDAKEFERRANDYSKDKNKHYYFMALRSDCFIDATSKGNISRFINHSCDPNAVTQKWTVNGELRVGFFSTKNIYPNDEITFDYQFERYGKEAQRCYCESQNCRGWIGEEPQSDNEDDEDDDDDDEIKSVSEESVELAEIEDKPEIELTDNIEDELEKICENVVKEVSKKKATPKAPSRKSVDASGGIKQPRKQKPKLPKRPYKRRQILEDTDLDKEILELEQSGLKNQVHTLKFSRVMVKAKLQLSQSKLLGILRHGEKACLRLFLDYKGLTLLHGWMNGSEIINSREDLEFRLNILQTLEVLKIPNKTILKDTKVLSVVQKWSKMGLLEFDSPQTKEVVGLESSGLEKQVSQDIMNECDQNVPLTFENDNTTPTTPPVGVPNPFNEIENEKIISDSSDVVEKEEVCPKSEEPIAMEESAVVAPATSVFSQAIDSKLMYDESSNEETLKAQIPQLLKDNSAIKNIDLDSLKMIISTNQKNEQAIKNAANEENHDLVEAIRNLACKLLALWENLPEVFRIPKRERIEQLREHEREANHSSLQALEMSEQEQKTMMLKNNERFREKETSQKIDKCKPRLTSFIGGIKRPLNIPIIGSGAIAGPSTSNAFAGASGEEQSQHMKMIRRRMFEAQVAEQEQDRRRAQAHRDHINKCHFFKLDPRITPPYLIPFMVNLNENVWYNEHNIKIPTPPRYVGYVHKLPSLGPQATNPELYHLPPMDLPPYWTYAISETGRIYYYHLKIRLPQWEPPIKLLPLTDTVKDSKIMAEESDSDDSEMGEPADVEELELQRKLDELKERHRRTHFSILSQEIQALAGEGEEQPTKEILDTTLPLDKSVDMSVGGHKKKKYRKGLVEERIISPRCEEDRIYGQQALKQYKENKEKLRKRREHQKRLSSSQSSSSTTDVPRKINKLIDGLPLPPNATQSESGDEEDFSIIAASSINASIASEIEDADIVTTGFTVADKIVDELDEIKRDREKHKRPKATDEQKGHAKKRRIGEEAGSTSFSEEARRIKDKFRSEISGVIVYHLNPYLKETCTVGRICNNDDFKHLARKLTHFVMLKELKHRDNTVNTLEVTDSVKIKSREFIKKYMTKYGAIYKRPENEPEYH